MEAKDPQLNYLNVYWNESLFWEDSYFVLFYLIGRYGLP